MWLVILIIGGLIISYLPALSNFVFLVLGVLIVLELDSIAERLIDIRKKLMKR